MILWKTLSYESKIFVLHLNKVKSAKTDFRDHFVLLFWSGLVLLFSFLPLDSSQWPRCYVWYGVVGGSDEIGTSHSLFTDPIEKFQLWKPNEEKEKKEKSRKTNKIL